MIDNIVLADVYQWDAPDYVDAFIESADMDGVPMIDEQLDALNEDSEFVYDCVIGGNPGWVPESLIEAVKKWKDETFKKV